MKSDEDLAHDSLSEIVLSQNGGYSKQVVDIGVQEVRSTAVF